jgi:hypothetical protein
MSTWVDHENEAYARIVESVDGVLDALRAECQRPVRQLRRTGHTLELAHALALLAQEREHASHPSDGHDLVLDRFAPRRDSLVRVVHARVGQRGERLVLLLFELLLRAAVEHSDEHIRDWNVVSQRTKTMNQFDALFSPTNGKLQVKTSMKFGSLKTRQDQDRNSKPRNSIPVRMRRAIELADVQHVTLVLEHGRLVIVHVQVVGKMVMTDGKPVVRVLRYMR